MRYRLGPLGIRALLMAAIICSAALAPHLRDGSAPTALLTWYFDQATLDAADCSAGYPCTNYHGVAVAVPADFFLDNAVCTATDTDGSFVGQNTASTSESTYYSASTLPTAKSTWYDVTKNFGYGVAGQLISDGVSAIANKVEEIGTAALAEANMLLPSSNYTKAITASAGFVQTYAGKTLVAGLGGV